MMVCSILAGEGSSYAASSQPDTRENDFDPAKERSKNKVLQLLNERIRNFQQTLPGQDLTPFYTLRKDVQETNLSEFSMKAEFFNNKLTKIIDALWDRTPLYHKQRD